MSSNDYQKFNIKYNDKEMQYVNANERQHINANEMQHFNVKERRARLIILLITGILIIGYGIWNVWRMVEAIQSPVIIGSRNIDRVEMYVPGVVLCGSTIVKIQCYTSAGKSCDKYVLVEAYDATVFVNMRGFHNLPGYYFYIFDPQKPQVPIYGTKHLSFNNSTQKIELALYSNIEANNTRGAITKDEWFFFGVFTEQEDPRKPALSYLYFKRIEKKQTVKTDAITGGSISNMYYDPTADVELVTSFITSRVSGIGSDPYLWCVFRIIPQNHRFDEATFTHIYSVELWYKRIEFTFLQLTANMGDFVSLLSTFYFFLLGSRRLNPWGAVQKYILKTIPPPPACTTTNMLNTNQQMPYADAYQSPFHSVEKYHNDPQIQRLRNEIRAELRAETQAIAKDIGKLKLYLGKHYLQGVVPKNE
ncbi:2318_t:CDS:2 [Ambispora gerdemannii]|uniref:2318_t:CDS:1 n=1 Tax=Ambispora gerdemannii TaxID=144530 RepID=A0A9N9BB77_9GLOM|nr:2318_t:CDS:2 [Ambispora gerdemannii]